MEPGLSILGSLAIAGVAFVGGLIVSDLTGFGQHDGVVKVRNATAGPLRSVEVVLDSCGSKTTTTVQAIASGNSVAIRFSVCGEGGQVVRAILSNGKVVTSSEAYVESGTRMTAEVTDNAVKL